MTITKLTKLLNDKTFIKIVNDENYTYDGDELSDYCGDNYLDFFNLKELLDYLGYAEI